MMMNEHLHSYARRVLIGLDDLGRSTIVSDANTDTRLVTEAFTRNVIGGQTSFRRQSWQTMP